MKANAVMLWLVVGVSALGQLAWAGDGPAAAASSGSPAPADGSVGAKSTPKAAAKPDTPAAGGGDTAGKATLASWLDLLAAQKASELIGTKATGTIPSGPVLLSSWGDFVRAVDTGRIVEGQIAYSKTIITAYQGLLEAARKSSGTKACGGEPTPPKGAVSRLALANVVVPAATVGGWLPSTFNPWLAAVQTMLGTMKGISDTLRPTVGEPSPFRVGLANDDLFPAISGTSREVYLPPVITQGHDADIASTVRDAQSLAGQMTQLATEVSDRTECKALTAKLTQSATALGNLAKTLQPDAAGGTSAADEALALLTLSKKDGLTVLDIQLTSENATDRGYSTLIPTSKRLMQSSVLARYRLHNGADGRILRSGTVAVFCQVVAREGVRGSNAFGRNYSSAELCSWTPKEAVAPAQFGQK
ncbi:hypothetical protein IMW82_13135 [Rhodanobacter sp. B2A1Ga4]|uniref:hypothetical protein n=1 Tax=Rhodanobacter sp. B2A1Ga4 TaxID=2778647 RepID=UPI001B3767DB|nr:hypothetical protein [Rhodanobacter sp. B2A1Ga4]MBQ4855615.1 hypothetical protein [Rhodanobacter sp. B2A1Ga4]